jgi:hypothetical protein
MTESAIERKFCESVTRAGGLPLKLTCPGFAGMPDRMVLFPGGLISFIELKRPGQHPRPLQISRHELLRRLGFCVYVLDNPDDIACLVGAMEPARRRRTQHLTLASESPSPEGDGVG